VVVVVLAPISVPVRSVWESRRWTRLGGTANFRAVVNMLLPARNVYSESRRSIGASSARITTSDSDQTLASQKKSHSTVDETKGPFIHRFPFFSTYTTLLSCALFAAFMSASRSAGVARSTSNLPSVWMITRRTCVLSAVYAPFRLLMHEAHVRRSGISVLVNGHAEIVPHPL
jgi:hypothetical protein